MNIKCVIYPLLLIPYRRPPNSSVAYVQDLRKGGRWFDPQNSQNSFLGLMKVIATGSIPLSPLSTIVSTMVMWESSGLEKYCAEYWLKELQENMDRCTGRRDKTGILLKTAFNTMDLFFRECKARSD